VKKIDLGQMITFIANVGVIAGVDENVIYPE
jgi:hypothetical protein